MKKPENTNSVGQELRVLRQNTSLGIKTVANRIGMNYTYLSKIENGYKAPSRDLVIKLCTLYETDPDEMVAALGMLPTDIQDIIRNNGKEVFDLLRERYRNTDKRISHVK